MPTPRNSGCVAAVSLFSLLASCGGGNKQATPSGQQSSSAPSPEAASAAATTPAKTYKTGDVVELDNWSVIILHVNPTFTSASAKATAGMRLVAVEFQVTNKAPQTRNSPYPFFCTMLQAPGGEHLGMLIMSGATPKFDSNNIPPNQTRTGWATYNAPDQAGLVFGCQPGLAVDATISSDIWVMWDLGL